MERCIAANAWIDRQRRRGARMEEPADDPAVAAAAAPGDEVAAALATREAMETLVSLLPPRQRVVLLLAEVFGFTLREVAGMIGSSEGAVKVALHRARAALRTQRDRAAAAYAGTEDAGGAHRPRAVLTQPENEIVERYLEAFNRRDPDAIAALLAEDAVAHIVGAAEEVGRDTIRRNSLSEWAAEAQTQPQWAEFGRLGGKPAVFVFYRTPQHERALAWIITLEVAGASVVRLDGYFFSPDLIRYAGKALGVPVVTHGYRYVSPPASPASALDHEG